MAFFWKSQNQVDVISSIDEEATSEVEEALPLLPEISNLPTNPYTQGFENIYSWQDVDVRSIRRIGEGSNESVKPMSQPITPSLPIAEPVIAKEPVVFAPSRVVVQPMKIEVK